MPSLRWLEALRVPPAKTWLTVRRRCQLWGRRLLAGELQGQNLRGRDCRGAWRYWIVPKRTTSAILLSDELWDFSVRYAVCFLAGATDLWCRVTGQYYRQSG